MACKDPRHLEVPAAAHDAYIRSEARRLLLEAAELPKLPPLELCRTRWLFYQGDSNYGLGNVLYDVASAVALALALNRTLIYGANISDRKFSMLLTWPGLLTLKDATELRRRARCGSGPLATQQRVLLAPDKCTFHRTWRRERSGHARCFRRLLGVNWLAERAPIIELSKVHAFTGLQTLLKSAHTLLRQRIAAFTGACISTRARPNAHGVLLATLMRPAPAVLHAGRWALGQQLRQQRHAYAVQGWASHTAIGSQGPWRPPQLALHLRAMSDNLRATNLTANEQALQMYNAMMCVRVAAKATELADPSALPKFVSVLVVSSSPELRNLLVRRINSRTRRVLLRSGGPRTTAALSDAVASGHGRRQVNVASSTARGTTEPPLLPLVFDWRHYVSHAPSAIVSQLEESERAASSFCGTVNTFETHRCNRSAHLRDWGPDPHWVAVVELLLVATVTGTVIGAGYPHFKVCNTFAQIGAALADASPDWLWNIGPSRRRPLVSSLRNGGNDGRPRDGSSVQLLCASQIFSTDWGSSMWRTLNATGRRGADAIVDCGGPTCLRTPLHPDLWDGLRAGACPTDGR